MRQLNANYAIYFNTKIQTKLTLVARRYKSWYIFDQSYLYGTVSLLVGALMYFLEAFGFVGLYGAIAVFTLGVAICVIAYYKKWSNTPNIGFENVKNTNYRKAMYTPMLSKRRKCLCKMPKNFCKHEKVA